MESEIKYKKTKGLRYHPLYTIWKAMLYRCEKPNTTYYSNYGGRGIKVCEEWHSLENFIKDMYPTFIKGLQIDRINNEDNYEPSNCRWITQRENSNNRRTNRVVTYKGVTKTVAEWVRYTGIIEQVFSYRLNNWSLDDVFNTPYPTYGGPHRSKKIKKNETMA